MIIYDDNIAEEKLTAEHLKSFPMKLIKQLSQKGTAVIKPST